jgi:hypothetical protein
MNTTLAQVSAAESSSREHTPDAARMHDQSACWNSLQYQASRTYWTNHTVKQLTAVADSAFDFARYCVIASFPTLIVPISTSCKQQQQQQGTYV